MQHCQPINLLGEACFGDLDFSMFKNRAATLHYHSTSNMGKRNKPISSWLSKKSYEEKSDIMAQLKKLGPEMRDAAREREKLVLAKLQEHLEETEQEKARKEERRVQARRKLADEIANQGGPCISGKDVTKLIAKLPSATAKANALKLQIRFQKIFFQARDDRLQVTRVSLENLQRNFIAYLDDQPLALAPTALEDLDLEEEEDDNVGSFGEQTFSFTLQGQTVAVYFTTDEGQEVYYIGQVLEVKESGEQAEVTFMEQRGEENCYKWPGSDKIDCTDSKYVFYSNFDIIPANRVWKIVSEHWSELLIKFRQYVQTFCRA